MNRDAQVLLIDVLMGINRELVISNHKTERMKKIQIQYFELEQVKQTYLEMLPRADGDTKEELMVKIREIAKKMTDLTLKGARDL